MAAATALTRSDALEAIADTPALMWFSGKRLLLTGGTGFVGSWLLELISAFNDQMLSSRCQVSILSRSPEQFEQRYPQFTRRQDFTYIPGDVRSFVSSEERFDFIIHAAAPADPLSLAQHPADVADTIASGTRHLLEFALSRGTKRFLCVSSGIVESAASEDHPSSSRAVYARAKRDAEALCVKYYEQFGLPVIIARPFTFMGPYQSLDAGFAITDFIRAGLQGKPMVVRGGNAIRSYAYGADLARWLLVILLQGKPSLPYNVGSDHPLTILTLAERVQAHLDAFGFKAALQAENQQPLTNRYVPDISRAKNDLGLELRVPLDEALVRTIRWHVARQEMIC